MKADLTGCTAIVGGCTKGIGKAIAEKFAENGANLVLLARNRDKLENLRLDLKNKYGCKPRVVVADFDEPGDVDRKITDFLASDNRVIDILVNNVRGPLPADMLDMTPLQMNGVLQRHVMCNHTLAMHFIPGMKRSKHGGRIINIIDTIYHAPYPGLGLSTVRASEVSWAKALSLEVAEYGITVNNILPGPTETDGLKEIMEILALKKKQTYADLRQSVIDYVPLKRFADPEEIAHAALFLASREASFVTGTNLKIDGGFTPSL